jgi:hypothetical protein
MCLGVFVPFLEIGRQILGLYLTIGHEYFLSRSTLHVINGHSTIRRQLT